MEAGGESTSPGTRAGAVLASMMTGLVQALGGGVGLHNWLFTRLPDPGGGGKDGSAVFAVAGGGW